MDEATIRATIVPGGFISVSFNYIEVFKFHWMAWVTGSNGVLSDITDIIGLQYKDDLKTRIDRCIAGM
jgi:hypothetical protein